MNPLRRVRILQLLLPIIVLAMMWQRQSLCRTLRDVAMSLRRHICIIGGRRERTHGIPIANLDDNQIVADLNATAEMLQMMNNVDPNRMAIAGHCMGGRVSFLGVAEIEAFKCNVAYYSGNMFKVMGTGDASPFEKLAKLRGPVLGFFGADDQNPSSDDVAKIAERLSELGIEHEFHCYEGAGHAFQNFTNPGHYRPAATTDSMTKMFSWLKKIYRGQRYHFCRY